MSPEVGILIAGVPQGASNACCLNLTTKTPSSLINKEASNSNFYTSHDTL